MRDALKKGMKNIFEVMDMLVTLIVIIVPQVYTYTCIQIHQIEHFKYMQYIVGESYLNKYIKKNTQYTTETEKHTQRRQDMRNNTIKPHTRAENQT